MRVGNNTGGHFTGVAISATTADICKSLASKMDETPGLDQQASAALHIHWPIRRACSRPKTLLDQGSAKWAPRLSKGVLPVVCACIAMMSDQGLHSCLHCGPRVLACCQGMPAHMEGMLNNEEVPVQRSRPFPA